MNFQNIMNIRMKFFCKVSDIADSLNENLSLNSLMFVKVKTMTDKKPKSEYIAKLVAI